MKLLLDTHTLLWWTDDDQRLPICVRSFLEGASNEIYVSVVNVSMNGHPVYVRYLKYSVFNRSTYFSTSIQLRYTNSEDI